MTATTYARRALGRAGVGKGRATLPFDKRLVLNQWLLSLFDVATFEDLARDSLRDPMYEGLDPDNVSRFCRILQSRLIAARALPPDILAAYDQNIVRHWRAIVERREPGGRPLFPKYFQYLALLFAEIYLDRYFRGPRGLLDALNAHVAAFNVGVGPGDQVEPYELGQLNKLAFWNATGSGKTLLMHVNLLQYRHYLASAGRAGELNRVILLTPNEGLSRQHLGEFALSDIPAELFVKDGASLFAGQAVEIIDVNKLRDDMGEKTVAVDAFEGNNLVLVDEGHRGAGGTEWMAKRDALCADGFSFEYSATFGQAMKAANKPALVQEYAKCILFDYSYKYFYGDGYGKDYRILNLADDSQEDVRQLYLTACLLAFYQQLRLYEEERRAFQPFLVERPLWVFVGSSVNAVRTEAGRRVSDVIDILLFLAQFARDRRRSVSLLKQLINGRPGLLDTRGHEIFENAFTYLLRSKPAPEAIFDDILGRFFNAPAPGVLHLENLKGTDGEISLRLGTGHPFGVVNVGDAANLVKLCGEHSELAVADRDFSGSLFGDISRPDSPVKLLVGSKKFSEGWNSWRVSTMGLMNVGRSEGSEIIQLFGRGVRLKGYDFSLKRSTRLAGVLAPQEIPADLRGLETLNVFGIRADYMQQFKEYLEDEGLPAEDNRVEFVLPVVKTAAGDAGIARRLRTIHLKGDVDFKRDAPKPTLGLAPLSWELPPILVDWYPKIQSQRSLGIQAAADVAEKQDAKLTSSHLAFLNLGAIYFALERFKAERSWHNLNLPREAVGDLLRSPGWYRLLIPPEELAFSDFRRVRLWEEIAVALLSKYCERYYKFQKSAYEAAHLEYCDLAEDDDNFIAEYRLQIEQSESALITRLEQLKEEIA